MKKMHIGSIIHKKVKESGISVTDFAKQLCCSRRNVYDIFNREHIGKDILNRISKILDFDFDSDYDEKDAPDCKVVLITNKKKLTELYSDSLIKILSAESV
jgi:predicted transcriptional regulator